jgi:hypothetical protein
MQNKKETIRYDADFSPNNPINVEAARREGLTYDPVRKVYIDNDGCLIRDEFGQRL